jgi:RNA polymerase sigma factor (sigma-70 family)
MNLPGTQQSVFQNESARARGEQNLLTRLQQRDREAQEHVFRTEHAALCSTAFGILGSKGDAAALVADVLTDFCYFYANRVKHERAVSSYLRIMVVRRSRRLLQRRSQEDDITAYDLADLGSTDVVDDLESKAWLPWLEACLSALTDRARKILRLHYSHDLAVVEVAGQLGVSKQAVSKTILSSIAQLRRCLIRKQDQARRGRP